MAANNIEPDEFDFDDEGASMGTAYVSPPRHVVEHVPAADNASTGIAKAPRHPSLQAWWKALMSMEGDMRHMGKQAREPLSQYGMPIDEEELDRIDLKHRLYTMLLGEKLFLAPIQPNPQRILDLGTGSGIWAIDMADAYTSAEVLGVDLAPIQPQWVPSNCRFEIDDVEEPWTYGRKFDFIHARDFLFSILDWQNLVNSCYEYILLSFHAVFIWYSYSEPSARRHTTPGGYTELQCLLPEAQCDDDSTPPDQGIREFSQKVCDASEIAGWSLREPKNYKKYMENAGFEDVTEVRYKGVWLDPSANRNVFGEDEE
ncbi:Secondary metabolism regulator [Lachnellula willkommii]|uniref:Secondary metabolism regulator n=1 Tax=Lachnellula willkommii TaxID=215461 RepID=A0A559MMA5_9HELO|nr:Secondary metabolism regulator [Lachnellula willkommii]